MHTRHKAPGGSEPRTRGRRIALWAGTLLLAIPFLLGGLTKLSGDATQVSNFERWGYPDGFVYLTGALEAGSALLLLIPSVAVFGAAGIAMTMVGAVLTRVVHAEYALVIPPLVFLTVALLVGRARWRDAPMVQRNWPRRAAATVAYWTPLFVGLGLLSAGAAEAQKPEHVVLRLYDEAFVRGDLSTLEELVAPEYVNHSNPRQARGPEGFRQLIPSFRAALGDPELAIHDVFGEDGWIVLRGTGTGTHLGEFFGLPATGRAFRLHVIDIFRVEDGRIVEHWDVVDRASLLRQFGALSAPEGWAPAEWSGIPKRVTDARERAANERTVRTFVEAFNRGDVRGLRRLLGRAWKSSGSFSLSGPDGFLRLHAELKRAFPDLEQRVEQVISHGDLVVTRATVRGTHRGDFSGLAATGRSVAVDEIAIYRVRDGRIMEQWGLFDELALLQQLGAVDPSAN